MISGRRGIRCQLNIAAPTPWKSGELRVQHRIILRCIFRRLLSITSVLRQTNWLSTGGLYPGMTPHRPLPPYCSSS